LQNKRLRLSVCFHIKLPATLTVKNFPQKARLAEQARKLALIAHEGDRVTEMEASWAIGVTDDCGARMVRIIRQNIADNEQERNVKRILNGSVAKTTTTRVRPQGRHLMLLTRIAG
jgi:hypothetical protein